MIHSFKNTGTEDIFNVCFIWTDAELDEVEIVDYHKRQQ